MTAEKLCNSIYLGDRYCKKVIIKDNKIMFQINLISRIKEGASEWDFYNDKDLENGFLVFDNVINYSIDNGSTINDEIEVHYINSDNGIYYFIVEGAEYQNDANTYKWVKFEIRCRDFYLLHKNNKIRE